MTRLLAFTSIVISVIIVIIVIRVSAQTPPEPGATPGVLLTNISRNTAKFASVFPQVAVSRRSANLVAVAWRRYGLPIDTNAMREDRIAECHVAISRDGGATFADRNMMDVLRTPGGNGQPLTIPRRADRRRGVFIGRAGRLRRQAPEAPAQDD